MESNVDVLLGATWECASAAPGLIAEPSGLASAGLDWIPATVPGTAGSAAVNAHGDAAVWDDYDGCDWWFRTSFAAGDHPGTWTLAVDGLATIADVWLNGRHLLHSENMFLGHQVSVDDLPSDNELVIRCAALTPLLAVRRPRPRWRSPRLIHQNLRWFRTTLLGRQVGWVVTPPPVGPWRPLSLVPRPDLEVVDRSLIVSCDDVDPGGSVTATLVLRGVVPGQTVRLRVGTATATLDQAVDGERITVTGTVTLTDVERWWPHTHGAQPLYPVSLEVGDQIVSLGRVGFRTVSVDRTDGAFTLHVNGVPIFCRGACWTPLDGIAFGSSRERTARNLELYRAAGLNMVRIIGETAYESDDFHELCDEIGVLLWQDAMVAFYDEPDDPEFVATVLAELTQAFARLQGRPSLAVVCGGSDTEEQAQFMGANPEVWRSALATGAVPGLVEQMLPGTPYLASSPGESPMPTMVNRGVAHYYGVGAYTRPLGDARRSSVRFAAECLAFATPPEPLDALHVLAAPRLGMSRHAQWKTAVHSDAHTAWDLEDVRDFYTQSIFGVDLFTVRNHDPERALALSRATSAYVFDYVLSEWRRADSTCAGSLVFHWHDLRLGAGLGIVDSLDRPKAAWFAMRRVMQPVAVLTTDEGLNGLGLHLVNDRAEPFEGVCRVELIVNSELRVESVDVPVTIPSRDGCSVPTELIFGGFRDLSYAHKFGKPSFDAVVATLLDAQGVAVGQAVHFPTTTPLPVEPDLGLVGSLAPIPDSDEWTATVSTRRLAQWVTLDVPGYAPLDGWFHLPPGEHREVRLMPLPDAPAKPRGTVTALNLVGPVRLGLAG